MFLFFFFVIPALTFWLVRRALIIKCGYAKRFSTRWWKGILISWLCATTIGWLYVGLYAFNDNIYREGTALVFLISYIGLLTGLALFIHRGLSKERGVYTSGVIVGLLYCLLLAIPTYYFYETFY